MANPTRLSTKSVQFALKNIGNPHVLRRSPLCQLPQVVTRAAKYGHSPYARAYALRDILVETCHEIMDIEATERTAVRVKRFLELYIEDPNMAAIARDLRMDRKNLYVYVMPQALSLVAELVQEAGTPQAREW